MRPSRWFTSLRTQVVLLLSVALFPLGAVAIYQTDRVADQARRNAELALLALTERAAKNEELIIERAIGAARFFSTVASDFINNPERCTPELSAFVSDNPGFSFVGILPETGPLSCSSSGRVFDISTIPAFAETMKNRERMIEVIVDAPLSGTSVFNVSEPFFENGEFAGFVSLSIPHNRLPATADELTDLGLEELLVFNSDGDVLTARSGLDAAMPELPVNRSLKSLIVARGVAFRDINQNDVQRMYTVTPIEGSPAAVMGVWRVDESLIGSVSDFAQPALFPILMWLASMSVAYMSIHTLVLRHIARLRINMDEFARNRNVDFVRQTTAMPNELQALNDNFARMTDDIIRDEAGLENALHEKSVLIKEVHHRVKNNLQLISSIMNMQIRKAEHQETRTVLSRLQDRVLSLATIHRDLYQTQNGGRVDVGALISEVFHNSLEMSEASTNFTAVERDIDQVFLYPDQAVPLSLMMAEATTNAMKYFGGVKGKRPWIKVSLKKVDSECTLMLANSVGEKTDAVRTGLGTHLINAFAIQLGGSVETEKTEDSFLMTVRFKAEDFVPQTREF